MTVTHSRYEALFHGPFTRKPPNWFCRRRQPGSNSRRPGVRIMVLDMGKPVTGFVDLARSMIVLAGITFTIHDIKLAFTGLRPE